jgi:hypothetical protein
VRERLGWLLHDKPLALLAAGASRTYRRAFPASALAKEREKLPATGLPGERLVCRGFADMGSALRTRTLGFRAFRGAITSPPTLASRTLCRKGPAWSGVVVE